MEMNLPQNCSSQDNLQLLRRLCAYRSLMSRPKIIIHVNRMLVLIDTCYIIHFTISESDCLCIMQVLADFYAIIFIESSSLLVVVFQAMHQWDNHEYYINKISLVIL